MREQAGVSLKVLIVDDEQPIRDILKIVLGNETGIGEVRAAADGFDALAQCRLFSPDVVVLDYWMPFMDGEATALAIRRLHPATHIVAFSAALTIKPQWADEFLAKEEALDFGSIGSRLVAGSVG